MNARVNGIGLYRRGSVFPSVPWLEVAPWVVPHFLRERLRLKDVCHEGLNVIFRAPLNMKGVGTGLFGRDPAQGQV